MKNVSYALLLLGKFSRVDAMSHWYKATEICRKKKAAEHTLFIYGGFFSWKQPYTFMQIFYGKRMRSTGEKYKYGDK